jgi:hypothetical protein
MPQDAIVFFLPFAGVVALRSGGGSKRRSGCRNRSKNGSSGNGSISMNKTGKGESREDYCVKAFLDTCFIGTK